MPPTPISLHPSLRFAMHEDGSLELLSPTWFPFISIAQECLDVADGRRLEVRGDELTIRCAGGRGAVYALGPVDEMAGLRGGRLLRAWP